MNIGFDLDKVFIDTPPLIPKKVIDKLYKKRDNGLLLYRIPGKPEQIFRKMTHLPLLRPALQDNLNFLKSLSKEKNKIYLISSRFKFLEKTTKDLIKRYKLDHVFDEMFFNFSNEQPHLFKDKIIKNLNLDVYVDDDLSLLRYTARNNPATKFYWLSDEKHVKTSSFNNIFRVYPLAKLSELIHNLKFAEKDESILEEIKPAKNIFRFPFPLRQSKLNRGQQTDK